jgi:hypothetical protein
MVGALVLVFLAECNRELENCWGWREGVGSRRMLQGWVSEGVPCDTIGR